MIKALVADLESVEEPLRALYTQRDDGKFILDVEAVDGCGLSDVTGLKTALAAERRDRAAAANALRDAQSRLEEIGDLDVIAAKDALKQLKEKPPATEIDRLIAERVEAVRTQVAAAAGAETQAARAELATTKESLTRREAQLQRVAKDNILASELTRVKPIDDAVDALLIMAAQHVAMIEVDGELVARVVDRRGEERLDANGRPMSIRAFMQEMRESRPSLFMADKPPIAGLGTPTGGSRPPASGEANPWAKGTFNVTQQVLINHRDPGKAARMQAEASTR